MTETAISQGFTRGRHGASAVGGTVGGAALMRVQSVRTITKSGFI